MIRENDIEKYLKSRCDKAGFLLRKAQWVGLNHCPDRLIMTAASTVWIELKAPGKKPRSGQLREHARMRLAGQNVMVIDSKEQVDSLINQLKRDNNGTDRI